jgi:hypothetical protein
MIGYWIVSACLSSYTIYSYSGRQLDTHYQKIMFFKNSSRNDAGTHRQPKKTSSKNFFKNLSRNDVGIHRHMNKTFSQSRSHINVMRFFFRVAVRSRIVAGTVFGEHDFLIMSVELAPGIAIEFFAFYSDSTLSSQKAPNEVLLVGTVSASSMLYVIFIPFR